VEEELEPEAEAPPAEEEEERPIPEGIKAEEWAEITKLEAELGGPDLDEVEGVDDPVRLYLREIGRVHLLKAAVLDCRLSVWAIDGCRENPD
jgi:hypothetical protein